MPLSLFAHRMPRSLSHTPRPSPSSHTVRHSLSLPSSLSDGRQARRPPSVVASMVPPPYTLPSSLSGGRQDRCVRPSKHAVWDAAVSAVRGPSSTVGSAAHTSGGVWGSRPRSPADLGHGSLTTAPLLPGGMEPAVCPHPLSPLS
jgi:hypothetical protein